VSAIAGFVSHDGQDALRPDLDVMLKALAHRGIDGSGAWVNGPVALGHQMWWSTPQSIGEQLPLVTAEGDIALTSDARIDNRDELCAELAVPHPDRASIPDSALIALAYRKWGEACPEHLVGEFVFVLWDARLRQLVCAVDILGSISLYYACPKNRFAFASEAKALQTLPGVPRRLNAARFADRGVVGLNWIAKEATFFEGIRVVPPGHTLTVRSGGMRLRRYWDPSTVPPPDFHSEDDFVEAMRERFTEAVRCRVRSAYPVASLLSGGLDSSAATIVAARELRRTGRPLRTISSVLPLDHPGPERDERRFIDVVTGVVGGDWTAVVPHMDLWATLADEFFWNERPSSPRHDIYRGLYAAAGDGGARTLLDGQGGELGMTAHGVGYLMRLFTGRQWSLLAQEVHAGSRVAGASRSRYAYGQVLRPLLTRHRERSRLADSVLADSPLTAVVIAEHRLHERLDQEAVDAFRRSLSGVREQRVYHATRMQKPYTVDAQSLGTRGTFPFKDRRVIELSLHLPESLTRYRGYGRGLVRRAFDGVLPPEIQWRVDKTGFSPDYFARLRAHRHTMRDTIESVSANDPIRDYLDLAKMRSTLDNLSDVSDWSRDAPGRSRNTATLVLDQGLILLHFLRSCTATGMAAY
jgi:asparagine synthase (glutamine-hydrolysing)